MPAIDADEDKDAKMLKAVRQGVCYPFLLNHLSHPLQISGVLLRRFKSALR